MTVHAYHFVVLQIIMVIVFQRSFNITEGIDGSATSYTIVYTDAGILCDFIKVPAFRCQGGLCSHLFDVSSSHCVNSTNISIAIYATNLLGDGPASEPFSVELYHRNQILIFICLCLWFYSILLNDFVLIGGGESSSCEYPKSYLDTPLFIGTGAGIIILLLMVTSILVIAVLVRSKAKLKKELEILINTKTNCEEIRVNDEWPSISSSSSWH